MITPFVTATYLICVLLLAFYASGQAFLLLKFWRYRARKYIPPDTTHFPCVTIQLPIYNEQHVVTRLLNAIAALDYPRDRLTVQVLDDSTDETRLIVARRIRELQSDGLNIVHIQRKDRTGFKAGALEYGMKLVDSELVAVFDADFVPPADFLKQTIPYLVVDPGIGVVQTRWGHLNAHDSWLTQAQMLSIDAHFVIEQTARSQSGWILPFNGTGGVWRAQCIRDAGGWSDITLTEDLELSYRAQLVSGWKSLFLPEIVVPGELPPQLAAYKQQQFRWAKGNTQCLKRFLRQLWRTKRLSFIEKIMATQHLCQYIPHLLMLMLLLLTPPLIIIDAYEYLPVAPLGVIGFVPPLIYAISQRFLYADWKRNLLAMPILVLLGTGITWNNTRAILSAFFGQHNEFRRTPKFVNGSWRGNSYALSGYSEIWVELLLFLYAAWGIRLALQHDPTIAPYLLVYASSFGMITGWGLYDQWIHRRVTTAANERQPVS